MKVLLLLLLLPVIGCQDSARPTITDEGRTIASPKNAPKAAPKNPVATPPKPKPVDDRFVVNAFFARYVDRFYLLMGRAGLDNYRRSVQFIMDPSLSNNVAGNCTYASDNNFAVIRINPNYWWNYDYHRRESLMFHELGHCVLYRGHNSRLLNDNRAESVMHPFSQPFGDQYLDHYQHYMTELFGASPEKFAKTGYLASYYWEHPYHTTASYNPERDEYITLVTVHADLPPGVECGSH